MLSDFLQIGALSENLEAMLTLIVWGALEGNYRSAANEKPHQKEANGLACFCKIISNFPQHYPIGSYNNVTGITFSPISIKNTTALRWARFSKL